MKMIVLVFLILIGMGYFLVWRYRVSYKEFKEFDLSTNQYLYSINAYHWYHWEIIRYEHYYNIPATQVPLIKAKEDSIASSIQKSLEGK